MIVESVVWEAVMRNHALIVAAEGKRVLAVGLPMNAVFVVILIPDPASEATTENCPLTAAVAL
jgi:hypothetical protein